MVSFREITSSLYGAYMLARRNPDALNHFNISTEGFYHSFAAMILAVPFFIFENAIDYKSLETETALIPFMLLLCVTLWVSWGAYLAVMAFFERFMGFSDQYSVFVIVYNWAQLALILVWFPLSIISNGILPVELASGINLVFIIATYVYLWYILRITLNVTGGMAVGFAFIEFLVVILIQASFSSWLFTATS
ncbi:hypothetical protein [uncultured Sneathiella sp.]|uniref:hypothetical protein n=1 Tax=uncultured Sneathiella sp. TaxID=879315 RepID=UPI0030D74E7B|tara:strand:- start:911 stop:1489 length:579 start_codon:yes stop_codon:yes gene_type:complete